jgi:hypothetical protein
MLEWGTRVNACPNGGTWVNAYLNGGGLLQDTVSPMGDMVHFFSNPLEIKTPLHKAIGHWRVTTEADFCTNFKVLKNTLSRAFITT